MSVLPVKVMDMLRWQQRERTRYISVGTVTRKGNSMRSMIWVGLMMVLLTACTKVDFDGFDPATSAVKWIITGDKK